MRKISYIILLLFISNISFAIGDFKLKKNYENKGPHNVFDEALIYFQDGMEKVAIDLGVGYGNETNALLEKGFKVLAFDASPESSEIITGRFANQIDKGDLKFQQRLFEDIEDLPKSSIILAINTLPFMDKKSFPVLWDKITNSLPKGGVFVGTFFGMSKHLKRGKTSHKIFRLSEAEVRSLFKDFEIVYFSEYIKKDLNASKSWGSNQFDNRFCVVAVKR